LRTLIENGLRAELRRRTPARRRTAKLRWVTVDGGLPEGLDLTDRTAMLTWLARNR
jgi:hypothetical protein